MAGDLIQVHDFIKLLKSEGLVIAKEEMVTVNPTFKWNRKRDHIIASGYATITQCVKFQLVTCSKKTLYNKIEEGILREDKHWAKRKGRIVILTNFLDKINQIIN